MESIRRRIKIFWLDHSDPILFYSMVIIGTIFIVQFFNKLAIEKNEQESKTNTINIGITENYNIRDDSLVKDFINYCKQNETQKAYELLSRKCKEELYPTYEEFMNNYYNKIFNIKRTIQTNYDREKNIYKINFYTDILESGGFTNSMQDYYKIEQDVLENKVYINLYKGIN